MIIRQYSRCLVRAACLALSAALFMGSTAFALEDVVIGGTNVIDPEIFEETNEVVWQDAVTLNIWLAKVDPSNGRFIPADGKGQLVRLGSAAGGNAAPPWWDEDGWGSLNGPEFGVNAGGRFIYLTVRDGQGVNQVARFGPLGTSNPVYTQLTTGGTGRGGALPTTYTNFQVGATVTLSNDILPSWRFDSQSNQDRPLTMDAFGLKGPRWIPGQFGLTTILRDSQNTLQAAMVNLNNNQYTILTNDVGDKTDAIIFDAPELGTKALMCITGNNKNQIAVYQESSPFWTRIATVNAPRFPLGGGRTSSIFLAEPFFYRGKTYFSFAVGKIAGFSLLSPSRIYVASLENPTPVQACRNGISFRFDPEVVVLNDKVYLYYYEFLSLNLGALFGGGPGTPFTTRLRLVTDFLPDAPASTASTAAPATVTAPSAPRETVKARIAR
jgi:hypothetical protein